MSSTTVIPKILDALRTLAAAELQADGVKVYDGYPVTDADDTDVLLVGVEDPSMEDATNSAESAQVPATMGSGRSRDETGTVTLWAESVRGNGDAQEARDAAFATVEAVEEICRTKPNLEIPGLASLVCGVASIQFFQNQTEKHGATAHVLFKVGFKARL